MYGHDVVMDWIMLAIYLSAGAFMFGIGSLVAEAFEKRSRDNDPKA